MIARLRWAEARDRWCRARRRLFHPWDFQRSWFRELAKFYRHLSKEEFWLRYFEGRKGAQRLAHDSTPAVWQETDYFVLRQAYYHRDRCFHLASALLPRGGVWLEYGCGIAPVSTWLARHRRLDAFGVLADVPGRTWDFAQWRAARFGARLWCNVLPSARPLEGRDVSLIICSEVLEHVPDPVATAQTLTRALARGGYLLVNFVETPPRGANLEPAQRHRSATLAHFAAQLETIRPVTAHGPDGIYRKPLI